MTAKTNTTPRDIPYELIRVGENFSFTRDVTEEEVAAFARLSEDLNPLHLDEIYAKETEFGGRIAHGMLLGSLFSRIVGMFLPGKRALYLEQSLKFHKPLMVGDTAIVSGTVIRKFDSLNIIEIKMIVKNKEGAIIVDGIARVKVRNH